MPKPIPWSERCAAECGRRKAPGKRVCEVCFRRHAGRQGASAPMKFGKPVAGTYVEPIPDEYSEEEQFRDLEELSRCERCRVPWGGHLVECPGYLEFLDATEEWHDGDLAEQL